MQENAVKAHKRVRSGVTCSVTSVKVLDTGQGTAPLHLELDASSVRASGIWPVNVHLPCVLDLGEEIRWKRPGGRDLEEEIWRKGSGGRDLEQETERRQKETAGAQEDPWQLRTYSTASRR